MVQAVADTMFYNETNNKGNFSQALDWVLTNFRLYSKYADLIKYIEHQAEYLRGSRTKESIEAMKHLLTFIESVDALTK